MPYTSLQEIIADQELGLTDVEPTPEAVQRAIDDKLRFMQPETAMQTTEAYRRLVDARTSLDRFRSVSNQRSSTEIVPLPAAVLDRLLDIIQKPSTAPEPPPKPPVIERMQEHRSVAVTKASQDFRHRRTLPLAGLGTIVTALWATRQAFGADLSTVGTAIWSTGAGGIIVVVVFLFLLMTQIQSRDERVLRSLYDPDVQANALRRTWDTPAHGFFPDETEERPKRPFTRDEYRSKLWQAATQDVSTWGSLLSTVDLPAALDDAAELAIARFMEMGVLASRVKFGQELFFLRN